MSVAASSGGIRLIRPCGHGVEVDAQDGLGDQIEARSDQTDADEVEDDPGADHAAHLDAAGPEDDGVGRRSHRKRTVQRLQARGFRLSDLTRCRWPKK